MTNGPDVREDSRRRFMQAVGVALACGVAFYVWMFAYLALLNTLMAIARRYSLQFSSEPVVWATHHLAIAGALVLFLAWLWTRDWARSLAIASAFLSAIVLVGFLLTWNALLRPITAFNSWEWVIPIVWRIAILGVVLSVICTTWYAANKNRIALRLFVGSPPLLLAAFLWVASPGYVSRVLQVLLPSLYPTLWSFLCITAALGMLLLTVSAICTYLRRPGLVDAAWWILGILAHAALYLQLCGAAVAFTVLMTISSETAAETEWRVRIVFALIALEALLALAVVLTLYLQRRAGGRHPASEENCVGDEQSPRCGGRDEQSGQTAR